MNVTGTATLLGTLAVSVINNFCPTGNFTIMTYGARVGDFTTKTGLDLGGGRVLTATAGPTAYTLSAPETCAANTSTDLVSTPNPSVFGQSVAFTATVTSGGSAVTVGTVTFKEGTLTLAGPTALNASGQAGRSHGDHPRWQRSDGRRFRAVTPAAVRGEVSPVSRARLTGRGGDLVRAQARG